MTRVSAVADDAWDATAFRAGIERQCVSFVDQHAPLVAPMGVDADRMLAEARTSVSGGKRLRAAFCWWGHLAVEPPTDEQALLRACASLELLHASALVHDDFIDGSDTRRGRPASHRTFEALHRREGWSGSAPAYGAAGAILLGDLLLSWSDQMMRTSGLPAERVVEALTWFDETRLQVVLGQFHDVSVQARGSGDVAEAMTVLRYKSAKYSVEQPLHIGAALAGASKRVHEDLAAFGLPLGEAFQLRDDLLGVFGDPEVTGKPAGDDLREGKRTVLIALALEALPAAEATELDAALGTDLDRTTTARLQHLITDSGARERVEHLIDELTEESLSALKAATITETARAALHQLADAATKRSL